MEIRNKIWTYVLGDQLIHIVYAQQDNRTFFQEIGGWFRQELDQSPWRHVVFDHDYPENSPDEQTTVDGQPSLPKFHNFCYAGIRCGRPVGNENLRILQLDVLRACRQMYVEAHLILWTTNTFSFTDGLTFKLFMMTRSLHQKRLIRTLRVEIEWESCTGLREWNNAITMALIRALQGLRSLRLVILCTIEAIRWQAIKHTWTLNDSYCDGLRKLSILPLISAEVEVKMKIFQRGTGLWVEEDGRGEAEELKGKLLTPGGVLVKSDWLAGSKTLVS